MYLRESGAIYRILKWSPRIASIIVWALVLLIFFGEGGLNPSELREIEIVMMSLFWTSCAGLIIGWRWPGIGGMISVGFMSAFFLFESVVNGGLAHGWAFEVIAFPGWLFLLFYLVRKLKPADRQDGRAENTVSN